MFKIAICAGHGINTPGKRTPDGEREWSFNSKVAVAFMETMKQYENVEVRRYDDPTGKTDVPLKTRTDKANAWGANIYISFHHNANTAKWGTWTGVETHVYKTQPADSVKLAKAVHPALVKAYGLSDRGLKFTDLHITRETKMPAILIEGGFMDSTIDIKKLRDNNVLKNAGTEIAHAVAKYAGLKKKASSSTANPAPTTNDGYFRLFVNNKQVGAYKNEKGAYEEGWKLYNSGKTDVYLTTPEGYKFTYDKHQEDNPKKK